MTCISDLELSRTRRNCRCYFQRRFYLDFTSRPLIARAFHVTFTSRCQEHTTDETVFPDRERQREKSEFLRDFSPKLESTIFRDSGTPRIRETRAAACVRAYVRAYVRAERNSDASDAARCIVLPYRSRLSAMRSIVSRIRCSFPRSLGSILSPP
jgi:hypothetical protein